MNVKQKSFYRIALSILINLGARAAENIPLETNVRLGSDLCPQEINYCRVRFPKVHMGLATLLKKKLSPTTRIPKIALVGSGGGYRAMCWVAGALVGIQKIGLLDSSLWVTALSGSTWTVLPWISSELPIAEFKDKLLANMSLPISPNTNKERDAIMYALLGKYQSGQPVSLVDLYGSLLANRLLIGDDNTKKQIATLSSLASRVSDGNQILPICTAIHAKDASSPHELFELTPFEVTNNLTQASIPSWASGAQFDAGKAATFGPETTTLAFVMGTCGSAFAAHYEKIYSALESYIQQSSMSFINKLVIQQLLSKAARETVTSTPYERAPFSAGELYNFCYGLKKHRSDERTIKLVDAGIDCNLPIEPIIRKGRMADIILVLDASAHGSEHAKELQLFVKKARENGLPFPAIDFKKMNKSSSFHVFVGEKPGIPTVMYLQLATDPTTPSSIKTNPQFSQFQHILNFDPAMCMRNDCSTEKFQYDPQVSLQLSSLGEFNILTHEATIRKTIDDWIQRNNTTPQ